MEYVYDLEEINKSPDLVIRKLKRVNLRNRVKVVLAILDGPLDFVNDKKVLLNFATILRLIKFLNKNYTKVGKYPSNDILIDRVVTAYKILIVMRRHFFLADGIMLTKKSEDRENRSMEDKKKLIEKYIGKFNSYEFDAAYLIYTNPEKWNA
jgi:hypothetical protein